MFLLALRVGLLFTRSKYVRVQPTLSWDLCSRREKLLFVKFLIFYFRSNLEKLNYTYVAFPSLRKTQDSVHSNDAETIFLVQGFNTRFISCWVDSTLAYLFMFTLVIANCRLFPPGPTYKVSSNLFPDSRAREKGTVT